MKHIIVEIIPPLEVPGGAKARPVGSKEAPIEIWASTEFPKAMSKMCRLKRLQGTQWEAVKGLNGWTAVKFIN